MRKELKELLEQEVVTGQEASQLFGLNDANLRQRVARKTLEAVKKGDVWLYDKRDLEPKEREV